MGREMDVGSRRVNSTHAWRGRRSRSAISSNRVEELWVGATRSGVEGLAAVVLTIAAAFFDYPAAGLVAVVGLGSGFLGLAVFLVALALGCLCASVTG